MQECIFTLLLEAVVLLDPLEAVQAQAVEGEELEIEGLVQLEVLAVMVLLQPLKVQHKEIV